MLHTRIWTTRAWAWAWACELALALWACAGAGTSGAGAHHQVRQWFCDVVLRSSQCANHGGVPPYLPQNRALRVRVSFSPSLCIPSPRAQTHAQRDRAGRLCGGGVEARRGEVR